MNSLYDFIVEPIGDRYDNKKTVGGKDLILNTKIESWKFVNRLAKVIAVPIALHTSIKIGDTIVVHQNIFRRFYNMKGEQSNSRSYFKDNLYFAAVDQIYLYKNNTTWKSFGDRCFIAPLKNSDSLRNRKEFIIDDQRLYCMKSNDIVIKYGNKENQEEYNPSWTSSS